VAGFEAGSLPGAWTVRVVSGGAVIHQRSFTISGTPHSGGFRVAKVTREGGGLIVEGTGLAAAARLHLAAYTKGAGWQYIAELFPDSLEPTRLTVKYEGPWKPGEYLIYLRAGNGVLSQPARFQVPSGGTYRAPVRAGERWIFTQGPRGSTHFGNTSQAFDIAPLNGRCIVAMRAGVAHSFDKGERQCFGCRSFGNYITIDHQDGDYSHYGHLKTGTFLVRSGQKVEQGQPLAIVGNSGYTLGAGGGVHLHVQVTRGFHIASQSVPFRFDDLPSPRGIFTSANGRPDADCGRPEPNPALISGPGNTLNGPSQEGQVAVAGWWNGELRIPPGTRQLDVRLSWEGDGREMDLHLVSPAGKHYGWYGLHGGYSGQESRPEEFQIPNPETGQWRVSVQGMKGTGEMMPFRIQSGMTRGR
jgi:murein DD-endopeptidase MepM/ murein hydrolase activator NlpD